MSQSPPSQFIRHPGFILLTLPRTLLTSILSVLLLNHAQASAKTSANREVTQKSDTRQAGYENVPDFGGLSSGGSQLKEDDALKEPRYRFDYVQQLLAPYCGFKKRCHQKTG